MLLQAIKEQQVIINEWQKNIKALQDNNFEQKELNNKVQAENISQQRQIDELKEQINIIIENN